MRFHSYKQLINLSKLFNHNRSQFDKVVNKRSFSILSTKRNIIKPVVQPVTIPEVTLAEYYNDRFEKWNNRTAIECFETGQKISYIELKEKSQIIAANLRSKIGLDDQETVTLLLPNLVEYPIIVLGVIRANYVCSTCNPQYTPEEIKKQIVNSLSRCVITMDHFYTNVQKAIDQCGLSENISVIVIRTNSNPLPPNTIDFHSEILNPNTNTDILNKLGKPSLDSTILRPYSSGTTGLPKGVDLTHKSIVAVMQQISGFGADSYSIKELGVDYPLIEPVVLPFFHIFGLVIIMLGRFSLGHTLIAMPKFSSAKFIQVLKKYHPHCLKLVTPLVLMTISNENITKDDLRNVAFILTGAAPISASDVERLRKKTNATTRITQGYGLTETSGVVAAYSPELTNYNNNSIGGLAANSEARFVDPDSGRDVGTGEKGEMWVRGPQLMKGYYRNESATRDSVTEDGWFKTGDIGYLGKDGLLYISDRLKELIKVKGFQVAPAELEGIIRTHPDVADCAVIGVPDSRTGEAPKAFVVTRSGKKLDQKEIQDFVAKQVSDYKRLTGGVVYLEKIPKNSTGKILRRELK